MPAYAADTSVSTEKSRAEIERTLQRYGATSFMSGGSWGQTRVDYSGDRGGRTYDGAAGGLEHNGRLWLCETCTNGFLKFVSGADRQELAALRKAIDAYHSAGNLSLPDERRMERAIYEAACILVEAIP